MSEKRIDQICPSCGKPSYREHGMMDEVKDGVLTSRYTCGGRLCISMEGKTFIFASGVDTSDQSVIGS
jgi:hypothetical protein